jgi:hypothetical protein
VGDGEQPSIRLLVRNRSGSQSQSLHAAMDAQRRQCIHIPEVVVKRPDSNPGDRRDFADGRLFESFLNQNTNKRFLESLRAGVSAALHRSATHSP